MKTEMTKAERAKWWKDYYAWVKTIYKVDSFEIAGKAGEKLYFHRNNPWDEGVKEQSLFYFLRGEDFEESEAKRVARNLRGDKPENQDEEDDFYADTRATIMIDTQNKIFNFIVDEDFRRKGYGRAIYENYLQILNLLGVENKEEYEVQVAGNANHSFLKNMRTEKLIARTKSIPNNKNALEILQEFAKHSNTLTLEEVNNIIEYAIKSGISVQKIGKALNDNGFNFIVDKKSIEDVNIEKFKRFKIPGLKPTRMHHHFVKSQNFDFMELVTNADKKDATLEFKRIFESVKAQREKGIKNGSYIPENLREFGELEHIILDWRHAGLFFKHVTPEVKALVKRQAIAKFDQFDPEHKSYSLRDDTNTYKTCIVLRDAGLLDKEAYIALYQKALNRNYNLKEFENEIGFEFFDNQVRREAIHEISQTPHYPCPKNIWQKSKSWGEGHRIAKIEIPLYLTKKGKIRKNLKQEILKRKTAKNTKIKTDMIGVTKDGRTFLVDNLKDWMFGVPGATGYMSFIGDSYVTFPPQTPEFAIEMVQQVLDDLAYPDVEL